MIKMKMLICDDDTQISAHYEKLLIDHIGDDKLDIYVYDSAAALLKDEKNVVEAELILLDICMGDMDGIHTAEMIRRINKHIKIVFISSSEDYVFDSFKVQPLNYLLKKKTSDGEIIVIIQNILDSIYNESTEEGFTCYHGNRVALVRLKSIIAFEIVDREIVVHTIHGDYSSKAQLQDIYNRFCKKGFERANRSCLVNMRHIQRIEGSDIYMTCKYKFPIAYRSKNQFQKSFQNYLLKSAAYE